MGGDPGEIYCEVVKGLGEVLVGNYPGRALSFTCNKEALGQHLSNPSGDSKGAMINVESFPSKSVGLYLPESLMFRSDSNGEDLEGYAGAGLYDSVPLHYPKLQEGLAHSDCPRGSRAGTSIGFPSRHRGLRGRRRKRLRCADKTTNVSALFSFLRKKKGNNSKTYSFVISNF